MAREVEMLQKEVASVEQKEQNVSVINSPDNFYQKPSTSKHRKSQATPGNHMVFLGNRKIRPGNGRIILETTDRDQRKTCFALANENAYSTTERESLATVWAIGKMRPYLEGYCFTVVTHHSVLDLVKIYEGHIRKINEVDCNLAAIRL